SSGDTANVTARWGASTPTEGAPPASPATAPAGSLPSATPSPSPRVPPDADPTPTSVGSSDVLAHEVALAGVNLPRAPARARGGRCPRTPCRRPHAGSSRSTPRAARMARTRVEMKQYLRTIGPWAGSPVEVTFDAPHGTDYRGECDEPSPDSRRHAPALAGDCPRGVHRRCGGRRHARGGRHAVSLRDV